MSVHRTARLAVTAAAAVTALAGCAGGGGGSTTSSPASSTSPVTGSSPTTAASPDPSSSAADAAMTAYRGFRLALADAKRKADPAEPGLAKYAQDKALAQSRATLLEMQQLGIVYKGAPTYSPAVTAVDLAASRPTVVIQDCVDNTNWHAVYRSSGKSAEAPGQNPRVPTTATVQRYLGSWLVFNVQADRSRTC